MISNPISVNFTEPSETKDLIWSNSKVALPCLFKILFRDRTKSGAVSITVPSRSNKTNFELRLFCIH